MVLPENLRNDLQTRVKEAVANAPGIVRPFIPTILEKVDVGIRDVPASLRDAKVGDVIEAYLEMRRKHII